MKRIDIDFAAPSLARTLVRARRFTWLALVTGLIACSVVAFNITDLIEQRDARSSDLRRINAQLAERIARRPVVQHRVITEAQGLAVNAAVAQLNLPWRELLDAVEAATPATIALLSIEPDAKKHLVRGLAEAKNSDTMIGYIEELKRQSLFGSVTLTKHEINEQDVNKPLRFQFEAQWSGDAK